MSTAYFIKHLMFQHSMNLYCHSLYICGYQWHIILERKQGFKIVIFSQAYHFYVLNKRYRKLERYVCLDMYIYYDIPYGISN